MKRTWSVHGRSGSGRLCAGAAQTSVPPIWLIHPASPPVNSSPALYDRPVGVLVVGHDDHRRIRVAAADDNVRIEASPLVPPAR
jgi:hypothetical protein